MDLFIQKRCPLHRTFSYAWSCLLRPSPDTWQVWSKPERALGVGRGQTQSTYIHFPEVPWLLCGLSTATELNKFYCTDLPHLPEQFPVGA